MGVYGAVGGGGRGEKRQEIGVFVFKAPGHVDIHMQLANKSLYFSLSSLFLGTVVAVGCVLGG